MPSVPDIYNDVYDPDSGTTQVTGKRGPKTHGAVSIGTSATQIRAASTTRGSLALKNNGAATVYIGGSGVTVANGWPLAQGDEFPDGASTDAWYGIVSAGTGDIRFIEV